jgi:hypothetical protein
MPDALTDDELLAVHNTFAQHMGELALGTMDPRLVHAFAWAHSQLGAPYDHEESACRFGNCPGDVKYDCSGFETTFGVQVGQPHGSLPLASGDMAQWLRTDGKRYALPIDQAKNRPGSFLIKGGPEGNGPDGHIVIVATHGLTYEANGAHGVCQESVNRLAWSDAGIFPVLLDHPYNPEENDVTPAQQAQLNRMEAAIKDIRSDEQLEKILELGGKAPDSVFQVIIRELGTIAGKLDAIASKTD